MEIKKLLGRKIKQYRILRGLSQEKLAELLNISQRTLSGIECGNNFLTSQTMDKILEVLKISPDELFYVEYLKNSKEMMKELIQDIKSLENNEEKLKIAYKVLKAIIKD
ncbi:MAG: helix-turn-helix transcriptional regulator [Candidatus Gastranaerophilales bacterium]|nr:helix-turn-helix transcriptional regulator [Candidatus Gastranaerophilales bacterium]